MTKAIATAGLGGTAGAGATEGTLETAGAGNEGPLEPGEPDQGSPRLRQVERWPARGHAHRGVARAANLGALPLVLPIFPSERRKRSAPRFPLEAMVEHRQVDQFARCNIGERRAYPFEHAQRQANRSVDRCPFGNDPRGLAVR